MTRQAVPDSQSVQITDELVAQQVDAVFAYAFRLTGRYDRAEDLTQQTFLLAHQRCHQLRDANRIRHWLLSIVRNCFLKECRRKAPVVASQVDVELQEVAQPDSPDWLGDEELVRQALAQLSEEQRIVVLMFYFEELSYREIASEMELPIGTVMSRLSRAKQHLRDWLASPSAVRS